MRKIDRHSASFWAAANRREGPEALGMLERARVKTWLRAAYLELDALGLRRPRGDPGAPSGRAVNRGCSGTSTGRLRGRPP